MFQGELIGIFITGKRSTDLEAVPQVEVVAGGGLTGDRYCLPSGTNKPDREVTLIESEALEGLAREYEVQLAPVLARRNLLTRNVPLNHLVGKEFRVGSVVLRGVRLCEPCGHLEKLTGLTLVKGLTHRGGLRAHIVEGGLLRVGDVIK